MKNVLLIDQSKEAENVLRSRNYEITACQNIAEGVLRAGQAVFESVVYLPISTESLYARGIEGLYKIRKAQPNAKISIGNPASTMKTDDSYETLEPDLQRLSADMLTRDELMSLMKATGVELL